MASVTDSIRAVNSDNYALLKLAAFAYVFFFLFELTTTSGTQTASGAANTAQSPFHINLVQIAVLSFLYSGFCSIIMNNRISQSVVTLPPFDPLKILSVCAKCTVVALPYLAIGIPIVIYAQSFFHFEGVVQLIAISIIELILVAIVITAIICFSREFKIKDSYNFKRLMSGFPDVLVYTFVAIVLLSLFNAFVGVPILWLAYSFFDVGPVFRYASFFLITMNLAYLADYCGQLSFDIEDREEM